MGSDKVEKRLPDDIIALIDQEASSKDMSRQEIISLLITAVKEANLAEENKELKRDIEYLHKQQKESVSEIQFLRDEISKFSSGLTSLAVTLGEGKANDAQKSDTDSFSSQIQELSDEITHLKEAASGENQTVVEKNLPLIIVSVLAGLLLIYLIISKVM
ncbi:hypothetical protein [uncultured Methanospirillum sp.]|uniref:hypothetical protein n=1 Tax=uncultured Methanospirillum sp. TaxID=262503 RepID=UPI0029C60C25|nr:hypothetical protein [uncultured Methanospirillum sp.]